MWEEDLLKFPEDKNGAQQNQEQKKKLIIDTNAFIKCLDLQKLSLDYDLYTTQDVIYEIKDKRAREKYESLALEIKTKEPSKNAKIQIQKFATLTGDNASLSKVDTDLLALCYTFSEENNTQSLLRKEPLEIQEAFKKNDKQVQEEIQEQENEEQEQKQEEEQEQKQGEEQEDSEWTTVKQKTVKEKKKFTQKDEFGTGWNYITKEKKETEKQNIQNENNQNQINQDEELQNQNKEIQQNVEQQNQEQLQNESSESSDGEGWINNENIHLYKEQGNEKYNNSENQLGFSLMTMDYAMQNVALQMGIPLVSIDGMLVKKARKFVLECYACLEIVKDTKKQFCPKCQNHTLLKVSCSVNADGTIKLYRKKNFQLSQRGFIYSIPKPKAGRDANNLVLREDELLQGNKFIKVKIANKQQDKEYKKNMADFDNGFGFGEIRNKQFNSHDIEFGYGKINPNNSNQFRRHNKNK